MKTKVAVVFWVVGVFVAMLGSSAIDAWNKRREQAQQINSILEEILKNTCPNPVCNCEKCDCGSSCECNLAPPSQAPRAEALKEVIMFSRKPCPACDQWWAVQRPKFEQAGYKVGICYDHAFPVTPHFLIQENGKTYEIVGAMSLERLKKEQAR